MTRLGGRRGVGRPSGWRLNGLGAQTEVCATGGRLDWAYNRRWEHAAGKERRCGGSMYFKQFYLGCLAHASYLIGSEGEAAVVDPQRDVDQYIEEAKARGFQIKYVIETHLHADFVSGHHELAERTGAQIVFGEKAGVTFEHQYVRDGEVLTV